MQTVLRSRDPELRALALVHGSRILAASPALADLTGYTRGELTSPEFRIDHIFAQDAPPLPSPAGADEAAIDRALVTPLRGETIECDRVVLAIQPGPEPLYALLLFAAPLDKDARADVRAQVAREIMRAYSSQLARVLARLRQTQIRIEGLEHASSGVLTQELRRAGAIIEALERLEAIVDALSRAAGQAR